MGIDMNQSKGILIGAQNVIYIISNLQWLKMDSIIRKIKVAEQVENMNEIFLANNVKKQQAVQEKDAENEQDSPEIPQIYIEAIDRHIRPQILDVMTASEAKSSLKLLDW